MLNIKTLSVSKLMKPILIFSLILATASSFLPSAAAAENPNVIVVMADDLGIGDVSPTNPECKIKTPHLQKMANEGLTFLDAHTPSSVCTPTRYGLLTGRYNWRSRLAKGVLGGTSSHLIPAERPTLGHLMRKAGYNTAMIGKWHLGWDWQKKAAEQSANNKNKKKSNRLNPADIDFTKPVANGPNINGFDSYYAHCGSLDMPPYVWVDTGNVTAVPDRVEGVTKKEDPYGWYRKGPVGSDFKIDDVLPHLFDKSMAHVKAQAEKAKSGKPFFLYLALPAPHTPIVPVPPFKDASGMNPYADFVMQVDHHMGQLLSTLKDAGIDDNTLVIFTSDNGCSPEGNFAKLKKHGHDPSAGYRGHKADIYEGGHRVPFIARWPKRIQPKRTTTAIACLTDVYSTLEDITAQPRQSTGGEDGFSLLPVFDGKESSGRESLISHSIGGSFAIRNGDWKLCLCAGSGGWSAPREPDAMKKGLPPLQLFNLANDRGEKKNVAKDNPEKVASLLNQLTEQVKNGRCTPGEAVTNDRDVKFLPKGVEAPRTRPQTRDYSSFPESSQRLHEFRGLREVVTEQGLLEHSRTYSLAAEKTGQKYRLWLPSGENVVVTLIDGWVSRIEGLPSDPAKAREAHVRHEAERNKAFTRYDQAYQEFAKGAQVNVTSASFLHVGEQAPVAWASRDRVLELGGLLAGMAKEPEPIPDSADSLNQKFDQLVWRLRNLAIPAFSVPGKVSVLAYPELDGEKQNPAREMLNLAQTPQHKNQIVARLIAMLQDRRPTRSWAGSRNGGHFYRNADVALEILDHLAFKQRRALEDLTFFTGSGRDAYLTTADEQTRQEVIARVKAWWRNQPFYKDANKATNDKEATDNNTSRLIIGKERGGQLTQEGIVYTLDFELIQIDQLQELLKHELKTSPGLKLLIHVDPELPNSLGAVAKQLATAAGVLDVQLATPDDK